MKISEMAKKLGMKPAEIRAKAEALNIDIGRKSRTIKDSIALEIINKIEAARLAARQEKAAEEIKKEKAKPRKVKKIKEKPEVQKIEIPEVIMVKDLASKLNIPVTTLITELMKNGIFATINENIDYETAAIIAQDLGFETIKKIEKAEELIPAEGEKDLRPRPPVVTLLGHVDHGKTTLLDYIRKTSVAAGEAGGITQHLGAYQAKVKNRIITFLDTPGHQAFSAMREHGAKITDIAVLVVAADDGVKAQTKEAINHAKRAGVPIIVAINKIDAPGADVNQVKKQLAQVGLATEDWGGSTVAVPISAKTGQGIADLLEMIVLSTDMEKLTAPYIGQARGVVIESHLDKKIGPVATLLVKRGQLKVGDPILIEEEAGKIRLMENYVGEKVKSAQPSEPVRIVGLGKVVNFGQPFYVVGSQKEAKMLAEELKRKKQAKSLVKYRTETGTEEEEIKPTLNLVIKVDVAGSLPAVRSSILALDSYGVVVNIIYAGVGEINDSDVLMAKAGRGQIFGFKVGVAAGAKKLASEEKILIKTYDIIYELIDEIKKLLKEMAVEEYEEVEKSKGRVLAIFRHGKTQQIIGVKITKGKLGPEQKLRIERQGKEVGEAKIESIKIGQEEVKSVEEGEECGLGVGANVSLEIGDKVVGIGREKVKR